MADIVSFVYGPVTSRFWLLRKHICLLSVRELASEMSFYGWDCITLTDKNQNEIYLVIKNERDMTNFLKFLIYELETTDGRRGTAKPLIAKLMKEE